jgi:uncharacterized protein YndB with AHSA1/START domain
LIEVHHTAHAAAPRQTVWALLADLEGWHTWGPWKSTTVDQDVRTLVSERRRPNGRRYVMKEQVTALHPPHTMQYMLLSGLPVRNYSAEVTLTEAAGGTDIHWHARFDPRWPFVAGLARTAMHKVIADVAEALAKAADPGARRTTD